MLLWRNGVAVTR